MNGEHCFLWFSRRVHVKNSSVWVVQSAGVVSRGFSEDLLQCNTHAANISLTANDERNQFSLLSFLGCPALEKNKFEEFQNTLKIFKYVLYNHCIHTLVYNGIPIFDATDDRQRDPMNYNGRLGLLRSPEENYYRQKLS